MIAIIAILASLLLPALAKAKTKAHGIRCMNNLRQLTLAWIQYTHENNDRLPYASADGTASVPYTWVTGMLNGDPANGSNWDIEVDIKKSPLWPYCGNAADIWKCPADRSTLRPNSGPSAGRSVPRVRSISMMIWMGGFGGGLKTRFQGVSSPPWRQYRKLNDLVDPGPSSTLLLWDQLEDSINFGNFFVDMSGYPDTPRLTRFSGDLPASYHNRAGGLSFADGHAEIKRWLDPRTTQPLKALGSYKVFETSSPNNRDIVWLQQRATRRPN